MKKGKVYQPKWFCVATEGATTDGRKISREWLEQMSDSYDCEKIYMARINLEHIKFRYFLENESHSYSYGEVLELKTAEREDGKLQLFAKLNPTEKLIKLNSERQKIFSSVEIDPNFADTGKAYLVGLAVTDNPASLGTSVLSFAAKEEISPFFARKDKVENVISEAEEMSNFTFEEEKPTILERVKMKFKVEENKDPTAEIYAILNDVFQNTENIFNKLQELVEKQSSKNEEIYQKLTALNKTVKELGNHAENEVIGDDPRPLVTNEPNQTGRFF